MTNPKKKGAPAPGMRSPAGQKKKFNLRIDMPHVDLARSLEELEAPLLRTPTESVAPTPSEPRSPTDSVAVPESVAAPVPVALTPDVTATPAVAVPPPVATTQKTREPQRRVALPESVAPTPSVGVRPSERYFRAANSVFDELLPRLSSSEQLVYLQLYRLSWGHQRETARVSVPRLAERCNLGTTAVREALRKLERDGRIIQIGTDFAASNKAERGLDYRVLLPDGTPTESVAPTRNVRGTGGGAPTPAVPMKIEKEHGETPAADAPADVYEVRKIAARVREVHHGQLGYTPERFRADVRTALIGAGRDAEDETVDEAIKGMAL